MATIQFTEFAAEDVARLRNFYSELFGWEFKSFMDDSYHIAETKAPDGSPGVAVGLMQRMGPEHKSTSYITVENLEETVAKAESLGAKIAVPKQAVPGMGYFVALADTEGNPFAVWQDDPNAK